MDKTYYNPADLKKFGKIVKQSDDLVNGFFEFYGKVFQEGSLSAHEKPQIALTVSHAVLCTYNFDY